MHVRSADSTRELAVAGVTSGLLALGDQVTWRARHFGVWQTLTSQITAYDRPRHFRDSQVHGAFRRFDHDHLFQFDGGTTTIIDVFDYSAPLGVLGQVAERFVLNGYMTRFLVGRLATIKAVAESDDWRRYAPAA